MRRAASLIGTGGVLLVLTVGVAYAATVVCDGGYCLGTNESDDITGSPERDDIDAKVGRDTVSARPGDDRVDAGGSGDTVRGNTGDDKLLGGTGGDSLDGGPGDDVLRGEASRSEFNSGENLVDNAPDDSDRAFGGPGSETFDVKDGDGDDVIDCGPEDESPHVFIIDRGDRIVGGCGVG